MIFNIIIITKVHIIIYYIYSYYILFFTVVRIMSISLILRPNKIKIQEYAATAD